MIMYAPSWEWMVAANVLLGVNQGLAWSMTVIMEIDLVGPRGRGLAVGLNEFAGYLAVGLTALATGYLAAAYGLRPDPFYLGAGYALLGLLTLRISWAIASVGALTFVSGAIVAVATREPRNIGRAIVGSGGSRGISRSHG
jgi:hypothetical protein